MQGCLDPLENSDKLSKKIKKSEAIMNLRERHRLISNDRPELLARILRGEDSGRDVSSLRGALNEIDKKLGGGLKMDKLKKMWREDSELRATYFNDFDLFVYVQTNPGNFYFTNLEEEKEDQSFKKTLIASLSKQWADSKTRADFSGEFDSFAYWALSKIDFRMTPAEKNAFIAEIISEIKENGEFTGTSVALEARCKAKWDKDATLRDEFMDDFDTYLAAEKAIEAGSARIYKQQTSKLKGI